MDAWTIFLGLTFGSIGFGFFFYGRKQSRVVPLVAGLCLMVFPYFVEDLVLTLIVGAVLIVIPFLLRV